MLTFSKAMDPRSRMHLESAYEAFENGKISRIYMNSLMLSEIKRVFRFLKSTDPRLEYSLVPS